MKKLRALVQVTRVIFNRSHSAGDFSLPMTRLKIATETLNRYGKHRL